MLITKPSYMGYRIASVPVNLTDLEGYFINLKPFKI